jgi:hypothetical protein
VVRSVLEEAAETLEELKRDEVPRRKRCIVTVYGYILQQSEKGEKSASLASFFFL